MGRRYGQILIAALVAAAPPVPAGAQTVTLDEGTFRILVGGQQIGTETFAIRKSGAGENAVVIAQGRLALERASGGEEATSSLEVAGPALRAYQVEIRGGQAQRIAGRMVGGRFSARILSSAGEMMREYLAGDGAVVLDDDLAHQYYFVAGRYDGQPFQVPVIIPRQSRQVSATVTADAGGTVQIDGTSIAARRFTVQPAGGEARRLWIDEQGRILRLEIPARNYVAERTALPR